MINLFVIVIILLDFFLKKNLGHIREKFCFSYFVSVNIVINLFVSVKYCDARFFFKEIL